MKSILQMTVLADVWQGSPHLVTVSQGEDEVYLSKELRAGGSYGGG